VVEVDAGLGGNIGQPETGIRRGRRESGKRNGSKNKRPAGHAMLTSPVRIA
jgi:hypothetical protein